MLRGASALPANADPDLNAASASFQEFLLSGIVCQRHHLQHLAALQLMTEAAEEAVKIRCSDSGL